MQLTFCRRLHDPRALSRYRTNCRYSQSEDSLRQRSVPLFSIPNVKIGKPVDLARDARADPHNIGGVVKLFLQVCASSPAPLNPSKEMEDPLLTAELYLAWLEAVSTFSVTASVG